LIGVTSAGFLRPAAVSIVDVADITDWRTKRNKEKPTRDGRLFFCDLGRCPNLSPAFNTDAGWTIKLLPSQNKGRITKVRFFPDCEVEGK